MLIFLGVENFAKIENAKICINNYTLLVGPNNSGKTYLMQLIQGINERLAGLIDEEGVRILYQEKEFGVKYHDYVISQYNIEQFVTHLNRKLEEKKEEIIREIFGKNVPIKRLYVDIVLDSEESYEIVLASKINDVIRMKDSIHSVNWEFWEYVAASQEDSRVCILLKGDALQKERRLRLVIVSSDNEIHIIKSVMKNIFVGESLFLPASRTGILLLYREFFANKVDDMISYQVKENQFIENKSNLGGLTQPVYQFLRFLQTYSENEERKKYYKEEIEFFEKSLIEGHINVNKQNGYLYVSEKDDISVPMYLASSMINEIAPLILALTDREMYECLLVDEIEASLHPKKQLELVKFLNRLNNKGIRLILSTHSDTFASKINNLYVLSNYMKQYNSDEIIKKLGMEKEDLVNPDSLFVYEFVFQKDGKSVVREINGDSSAGFQFDLFTDSAMHLYNEALEIGEVLQNDKA